MITLHGKIMEIVAECREEAARLNGDLATAAEAKEWGRVCRMLEGAAKEAYRLKLVKLPRAAS